MNVEKDACDKEHRRVDENMIRAEKRLNAHSEEIVDLKQLLLKVTFMVDNIGKKSIFDKMLITSVFIIGVVLLAIVLGPEISGKFVGGVIK